jgi:hypothetical protein
MDLVIKIGFGLVSILVMVNQIFCTPLMANLVWNFEWKTLSPESNVDLSEKQEFTMVMKHPLEAQISPRN